jgi:hypothetical protein
MQSINDSPEEDWSSRYTWVLAHLWSLEMTTLRLNIAPVPADRMSTLSHIEVRDDRHGNSRCEHSRWWLHRPKSLCNENETLSMGWRAITARLAVGSAVCPAMSQGELWMSMDDRQTNVVVVHRQLCQFYCPNNDNSLTTSSEDVLLSSHINGETDAEANSSVLSSSAEWPWNFIRLLPCEVCVFGQAEHSAKWKVVRLILLVCLNIEDRDVYRWWDLCPNGSRDRRLSLWTDNDELVHCLTSWPQWSIVLFRRNKKGIERQSQCPSRSDSCHHWFVRFRDELSPWGPFGTPCPQWLTHISFPDSTDHQQWHWRLGCHWNYRDTADSFFCMGYDMHNPVTAPLPWFDVCHASDGRVTLGNRAHR